MSYKEQWNDYKKRIRIFWSIVLVFVIALAIGLPLAVTYLSAALYYVYLFAVVGAGLGLNIYRFYLSFWKCPRCHKPFFRKPGLVGKIMYSYFARHCMNCGLPKWAQDDAPDKNIKERH